MSTTEDGSSAASRRVQQAPGLWRTDLQQQDLRVPGHEVIQARVDLGPTAPSVKHTPPRRRDHLHPGRVAGVPGRRPADQDLQRRGRLDRPSRSNPRGAQRRAAATRPNSPLMSSRKASRSSRWSTEWLPPTGKSHDSAGETGAGGSRDHAGPLGERRRARGRGDQRQRNGPRHHMTCPIGHADRRGILASTATKQRRSS